MADWFDEQPGDFGGMVPPAGNMNPPPTQTANPSVGGSTSLSPQQYVEAWRQQHPNLKLNQANSQAAWEQLAKDMNAVGFHVALDERADGMHKGINLDGNFVKLADGNDNAIWLPGGNAPSGGSFDPNTAGSLLTPYPGYFASAAGSAPQLNLPEFVAPTGEEVLKGDPSYQFRVGQGLQALRQGRAAQGTLNTGGTLKDILEYGQKAASQEYGNFFDRSRSVWGLNRDRLTDMYNASYKNYLDQYNMFRQRQQDTNTYLTDQQRIGLQANS